jgi:hypothetical protein
MKSLLCPAAREIKSSAKVSSAHEIESAEGPPIETLFKTKCIDFVTEIKI